MDKELLAYGIDITHELDLRFGLLPKLTMSQVRTSSLSWPPPTPCLRNIGSLIFKTEILTLSASQRPMSSLEIDPRQLLKAASCQSCDQSLGLLRFLHIPLYVA